MARHSGRNIIALALAAASRDPIATKCSTDNQQLA